jgi:hypothetical protein
MPLAFIHSKNYKIILNISGFYWDITDWAGGIGSSLDQQFQDDNADNNSQLNLESSSNNLFNDSNSIIFNNSITGHSPIYSKVYKGI